MGLARSSFQVLALDGGGIRGIFTAALLARVEEDLGLPVVDAFDLVVGTSTGGIIALALGAGLSAREIVDFYVAERSIIFGDPLRLRRLRQLARAKYSPDPLERALRQVLGERLLGESSKRLVVPAFDLGENAVHLFKTPHHERLTRDHRLPMWAVAMATTAAPTYFPAFELPGEQVRLIDGGVWANNPALVGLTEAVSMCGQPLDRIRVLSIGTTTQTRTRRRTLDNAGLLRWARSPHVVDVLLAGQSAGAFAQVQHLVGKQNAIRIDPPAGTELAALDHCDARELLAKASHWSRQFSPVFADVFGEHEPALYVPLHGPRSKEAPHVSTQLQ